MENDHNAWILDSGATNHVCSSLKETSFFQQFDEGKMTLKVIKGDVISAHVVGVVKLLRNRYLFFGKFVPKIRRNLISIYCLVEQLYSVKFSIYEVFIFEKWHTYLFY